MKKGTLLALFLIVALAASPAAARELRFGHVGPSFHGQHVGAEALAELVKEKTGGSLTIKVFPMGQLGGEMSLAEQVQSGTLDMAAISTEVLMNFVPQAAVVHLPFIFPNRETAYAVLGDAEFQEKFFSFFPAKGFYPIGWTENEFRDMTNSKHPIRTPEDLKGLKMRVIESPVYFDTFTQLGASPVGLPFPEIYSALQQGVIDGQENPLYTSILIKATEVNKFATRTQHTLTECPIIVTTSTWESLTSEEQAAMKEGAALCIKVNREHTAAAMNNLPKIGKSVDEYLKEQNVEVVDLTPEERSAFTEAVKPVWDKYRKVAGEDFFDFFTKRIESLGK